ncbi:MAG: MaoC family dehydratase [Dehalococcoidales bacterium]|nr:MaoC family dehydratase [Dehalococcoidales bacterium]
MGFEFPEQSYVLDSAVVSLYLEAVKDDHDLYLREALVPPMAVTAFAMASLSGAVAMPDGTIHVSQELEFLKPVKVGDTITCRSRVSRKVDRGGLHLMNTDISVINQDGEVVLTGKVGFVLPSSSQGGKE